MTIRRNKGVGAAVEFLRDHANDTSDECLIWPFCTVNGYGEFGYLGRKHYAHRFMCELANGPPPTPQHEASHSCGNGHRRCVSPKHLSWKTRSENQLDRASHGRTANSHKPKITLEQAAQIRALRGKFKQRELAVMFGCSRANISLIHNTNVRIRDRWPADYVPRRASRHQSPQCNAASNDFNGT